MGRYPPWDGPKVSPTEPLPASWPPETLTVLQALQPALQVAILDEWGAVLAIRNLDPANPFVELSEFQPPLAAWTVSRALVGDPGKHRYVIARVPPALGGALR